MRSHIPFDLLALTALISNLGISQMNLKTLPADSVTQTTAVISGWYIYNGIPNDHAFHFDFGRTLRYEISYGYVPTTISRWQSGDTFFVAYHVTGLMPNTTWHYRTFQFYLGTGFDESFTTLTDSSAAGFVVPITFA